MAVWHVQVRSETAATATKLLQQTAGRRRAPPVSDRLSCLPAVFCRQFTTAACPAACLPVLGPPAASLCWMHRARNAGALCWTK